MSTSKADGWRRIVTAALAVALVAAALGYYAQASPAAVVAQLASSDAEAQEGPGGAGDVAPALASGPGVTRPGILLDVRATPDGDLAVTETVRLRSAIDRIRLRAPLVDGAGDDFTDLTPVATSVELVVGDLLAEVPEEIGDDPTQVYLPAGATAYTLRYVVEGASVPGRTPAEVVVAAGPLSQAGPAGRVNLVAAAPALALTCPLLEGNDVDCGTSVAAGYQLRAPLPGRSALVLVRSELPEA